MKKLATVAFAFFVAMVFLMSSSIAFAEEVAEDEITVIVIDVYMYGPGDSRSDDGPGGAHFEAGPGDAHFQIHGPGDAHFNAQGPGDAHYVISGPGDAHFEVGPGDAHFEDGPGDAHFEAGPGDAHFGMHIAPFDGYHYFLLGPGDFIITSNIGNDIMIRIRTHEPVMGP